MFAKYTQIPMPLSTQICTLRNLSAISQDRSLMCLYFYRGLCAYNRLGRRRPLEVAWSVLPAQSIFFLSKDILLIFKNFQLHIFLCTLIYASIKRYIITETSAIGNLYSILPGLLIYHEAKIKQDDNLLFRKFCMI